VVAGFSRTIATAEMDERMRELEQTVALLKPK
jgi:hypothetical protein